VKKRLKFIEAERTAWQCDVENRITSTPSGQNAISCPRNTITSTTPLQVIQYVSTSKPRAPLTSPIASYLHTPSVLLDGMADVQCGLEEVDGAVRRCLFPEDIFGLPTHDSETSTTSTKVSKKQRKSRLKRL
jgi:hypothetical protein